MKAKPLFCRLCVPVNFPITALDKFNSDSCRLKWNSIRGQNYQIQCKTNLTDLSRTPIETLTATTTTLSWTDTGLTGMGQRVDRVTNTQKFHIIPLTTIEWFC